MPTHLAEEFNLGFRPNGADHRECCAMLRPLSTRDIAAVLGDLIRVPDGERTKPEQYLITTITAHLHHREEVARLASELARQDWETFSSMGITDRVLS